jgi:DNA-binding Xre family transcriptional regulator
MTRSEYLARLRANVAHNVRFHRYQLGLNQKDLAARVGFSENRIYTLETPGKGAVTLDTLASIAHELGLKVADLVAFREAVPAKHGQAGARFLNHQRELHRA